MSDFDYSSLEPYGLLDAIAAGFEEGLHPELRRLLRECKAAALQLQSVNVVAFPSKVRVAGHAPQRQNEHCDILPKTADIIDMRLPVRKAGKQQIIRSTPK